MLSSAITFEQSFVTLVCYQLDISFIIRAIEWIYLLLFRAINWTDKMLQLPFPSIYPRALLERRHPFLLLSVFYPIKKASSDFQNSIPNVGLIVVILV